MTQKPWRLKSAPRNLTLHMAQALELQLQGHQVVGVPQVISGYTYVVGFIKIDKWHF